MIHEKYLPFSREEVRGWGKARVSVIRMLVEWVP